MGSSSTDMGLSSSSTTQSSENSESHVIDKKACVKLVYKQVKINKMCLTLMKLSLSSLAVYKQVNLWGYCLNFRSKFLLNPISAKQGGGQESGCETRETGHFINAGLQVETVFISDQVHCQTKVSISPRTANLGI